MVHEELIFTEPAQFVVYGDGRPDPEETPKATGNGLVEVRKGAIMVLTGTQSDRVHVTVNRGDVPTPLPASEWTEVVEVSFTVNKGSLRIGTVDLGWKPTSPSFATPNIHSYRIRFSAKGRDDAWARAQSDERLVGPSVVEHHLIEIWPAPPAPVAVIRYSDTTGGYYRRPITPPS